MVFNEKHTIGNNFFVQQDVYVPGQWESEIAGKKMGVLARHKKSAVFNSYAPEY